ncbi:S41 family peptidase [soil metagenome]
MNKKIQVWLPLLFSITMIVGMMLGYKMRDNMPGKNFFSTDKRRTIQEVMDLIETKYVDTVQSAALSDTAISAILGKLDPHSVFIPADELQGVNDDIAGNFFGIGVEFNIFNDTINVINVVPDGPSFKAGIKTGDKFIKVNETPVAGKKITGDQIRKLLRGDLDTKVVITVLRESQTIPFTISRGMIPVSSVDASYIIENGIGYIRLNKFSQSTYREFMQAMEALQKQGLKKLILDLRGNGGGILDEATSIADEFLDGDKLIVYTEGTHFAKKEYRCKRPGLFENGELVVLADEGTASASEILIGALQDWNRATIVGRRSFGKGLVQEQFDLSDGSALRLTIARYYTPIGRSIQRPYTNGGKAYYEEVANRFHDGEVNSADSVKHDTTKMYKTQNGTIVYGGGGITPDIFIPVDTADFSIAFTKVFYKGLVSDFGYHYYLQNATQLNNFKTTADFIKNFNFTEDNWNQFVAVAAKDSIRLDTISEKEKTNLIARIQSSIARQLWRNEGLYEILNTKDKAVLKSVELLSK